MKKLALISALALLSTSAAAYAVPPGSAATPAPEAGQTAATPSSTTTTTTTTTSATVAPKAGDVVYDNTGQQAGSVESVNGDAVVVATTQGKGSMPLTEFAMSDKGLMMNHTKAELETAIAKARTPQAPAPSH